MENGRIAENKAIEVVCKLALTFFRPLVTKGLNFKNHLLWSLLMRFFEKNAEIVQVV
jgi:hypothetical protein